MSGWKERTTGQRERMPEEELVRDYIAGHTEFWIWRSWPGAPAVNLREYCYEAGARVLFSLPDLVITSVPPSEVELYQATWSEGDDLTDPERFVRVAQRVEDISGFPGTPHMVAAIEVKQPAFKSQAQPGIRDAKLQHHVEYARYMPPDFPYMLAITPQRQFHREEALALVHVLEIEPCIEQRSFRWLGVLS